MLWNYITWVSAIDNISNSCAVYIVRHALSTNKIAATDQKQNDYGIGERQSENVWMLWRQTEKLGFYRN